MHLLLIVLFALCTGEAVAQKEAPAASLTNLSSSLAGACRPGDTMSYAGVSTSDLLFELRAKARRRYWVSVDPDTQTFICPDVPPGLYAVGDTAHSVEIIVTKGVRSGPLEESFYYFDVSHLADKVNAPEETFYGSTTPVPWRLHGNGLIRIPVGKYPPELAFISQDDLSGFVAIALGVPGQVVRVDAVQTVLGFAYASQIIGAMIPDDVRAEWVQERSDRSEVKEAARLIEKLWETNPEKVRSPFLMPTGTRVALEKVSSLFYNESTPYHRLSSL